MCGTRVSSCACVRICAHACARDVGVRKCTRMHTFVGGVRAPSLSAVLPMHPWPSPSGALKPSEPGPLPPEVHRGWRCHTPVRCARCARCAGGKAGGASGGAGGSSVKREPSPATLCGEEPEQPLHAAGGGSLGGGAGSQAAMDDEGTAGVMGGWACARRVAVYSAVLRSLPCVGITLCSRHQLQPDRWRHAVPCRVRAPPLPPAGGACKHACMHM